jgi:hypothetical protein
MRESAIEKYLVKQVAAHGGVAEKFKSPGKKNVPDRIISWPDNFPSARMRLSRADFVEVKTLLGKCTPGQHRDHIRRRGMGFVVVVVKSKTDVDMYIRKYAPNSPI